MATVENNGKGNKEIGKKYGDGRAERTDISLSQAILGPLDAIFKAQLHGARSFLNLLLQIGYRGTEERNTPQDGSKIADGTPFNVSFNSQISENGIKKNFQVSIPALALIPIQPIAIDSAEYELELTVRRIFHHGQIQKSRKKMQNIKDTPDERPWFLVPEPLSIRGVLASPAEQSVQPQKNESKKESFQGSIVKIKVKVDKAPMPSGLSKLLTTLTEMRDIKPLDEPNDSSTN